MVLLFCTSKWRACQNLEVFSQIISQSFLIPHRVSLLTNLILFYCNNIAKRMWQTIIQKYKDETRTGNIQKSKQKLQIIFTRQETENEETAYHLILLWLPHSCLLPCFHRLCIIILFSPKIMLRFIIAWKHRDWHIQTLVG